MLYHLYLFHYGSSVILQYKIAETGDARYTCYRYSIYVFWYFT